MKSILTLTMNPTIDFSASVARVFPNHKLRCGSIRRDPGGGGLNVSRVIDRLGGASTALYCGGGTTGRMLEEMIGLTRIRQLVMPVMGETRQSSTFFEEATGDQYRFVMPGPILTEVEWRGVLDTIASQCPLADFVVASGSLPPGVPEDFYARLARIVNDKGSKLILDTSGPPLELAVREGVYLIKPSLRELAAFSMENIDSEEKQECAAARVAESTGCAAVVVSLGAKGVILATVSGCHRVSAPSVAVRSRVGAGDSMVAGITYAVAQGKDLLESVRVGVAAGTAAVMNVGTELCHLADVERLVDQVKVTSLRTFSATAAGPSS